MGGIGFSPICFEHDVIQRSKYVLKKADATIADITGFFIVLKPVVLSNVSVKIPARQNLWYQT